MSYRGNNRKFTRTPWDKPDFDVLKATSENFRIDVDLAIQKFLADDSAKEYSFPPSLNNFERKHIHHKAAMSNLRSRSHGKHPNRMLRIYKQANKSNFESFYIDLATRSQDRLTNVMPRCTFEEVRGEFKKWTRSEKSFGRLCLAQPTPVADPTVSPKVAEFQRQLPIYEMKQLLVDKIRNNRVLIISSETGSGKTTQIPQYIMDDARLRGEACRIICTQPRRISTVAVAERVSYERGSRLGDSVGYHIRLESKIGTDCNLIYCTNGVLIRSLMSGDHVLSCVTHIIIDEVHERDKLSDFLLICLRECLRKGAHIKLILMSATIDIEKFQQYFCGSEVVSIPGRLYTIKQIFLDEILELTGYKAVLKERNVFFETPSTFAGSDSSTNFQYDEVLRQCVKTSGQQNEEAYSQLLQFILYENMPVNYQDSETGVTALMIAVKQENVNVVEQLCSLGSDPNVTANDNGTAMRLAENAMNDEIPLLLKHALKTVTPKEDLLSQYYQTIADETINYDLLSKLIYTLHLQCNRGAILVFLPGYDDIMICNDRIEETILNKSEYRVFFLHGSMNIREQHEVFNDLGVIRKIILSTNIAETSLTIDDVVYVIDSGKAKVQTYDSCTGLSSLQTQWISKACVKQRAGRAGRTRSGACFHLFSKLRYDSFLDERIPEILRVPLEELCLNTKTVAENVSSIYNFLVLAPDPPSPNTVKIAIDNLECLGALDSQENLTPLGEYLSQLTIEPHLGKMLIYSVIFKCLDPVLTIVASLAQKDPFQLPPQANMRTSAAEKRKSLTEDTFSDHMIYLNAFMKWQDSVRLRKENMFCREFFISRTTMDTILKTRTQLLGQLRGAKFVAASGSGMVELNKFSENWPLVKAVITAGLYPKLAFKKNGQFCTRTEKKVLIQNSSLLNREALPVWLVYDEMVKVRNGHQVRGVTPVTPLTVALMCGIKVASPIENYLELDEWLEFEFPTSHVIALRKAIDLVIRKKLANPCNKLDEQEEEVLSALSFVLMCEDEAINMSIPVGIQCKPKFFELNRNYEPSGYRHDRPDRPDIDPFNRGHVVPSTSSGLGHSGSFSNYRRQRNFRSDFRQENGSSASAYSTNNGPSANHYLPDSAPSTSSYRSTCPGRSQNQHYMHGMEPKQYQNVASTSTYFRGGRVDGAKNGLYQNGHAGALDGTDFANLELSSRMSSMSFGLSSITANSDLTAVNEDAPDMVVDNSAFILIRVKQENSVWIAFDTSQWTFAPQTEKQIQSLDNRGVTVYLLYTVHRMNNFYGIAQFIAMNSERHKPSAAIVWKVKAILPYKKVSHLRNPLNSNRLVYDGFDGQEVDGNVALQLWELLRNQRRQKQQLQYFPRRP